MISHEYKCIFIHIPKCAGTSIESVLGHLDNHSGRDGQDHRSLRMIEQPLGSLNIFRSKENLREVGERLRHKFREEKNFRNKYTVTGKQYNDYFKFSFVRNPWARAHSWYKNVMRDEIHREQHHITGDMPFNDFLKRFAGKGMLQTQTYWIKNYKGFIPLDYIGRFENLMEDFREICKKLNVSLTLPHKKKGTGEDYRKVYDIESIDLIKKVYQEEIQLFNYYFEE